MNVSLLLEVPAEIDPERVIATDVDRSLTLGELRRDALALGAALSSRELPAGPVALLATNSVVVPLVLFAAAIAGRPLVPLNFRADRELMAHFLSTSRPSVIVADPRYRARAAEAAPWAALLSTDALPSAPDASAPAIDPEEPALRLFTSGTTGRPKAITLRHRHLASYVIGSIEPVSEPLDAASLVAAPCYHIASLAGMLTSTYAGRRMVFLESFSPDGWLRLASAERVTHAFVVPTMLYRIVEELEQGAAPPRTLTTLAYGGSPAPSGLVERAMTAFPPSVGFVNAYGLTETSSTVAILGPDDHRAALASADPAVRHRLSSVGRPLPGIEVSISGEGEVLVRGPQVSHERDAGARPDQKDGWLRTGDLGEIDEDGYVFVFGRRDDTIIRGGENIWPGEIEDVLRSHPAIRDAAVVGIPDSEWGERIEAVIEGTDVDTAALAPWVRGRLPGFKCPVRFLVVDELPRNALGKVVRPAVRGLLGQTASAAIR